MSDLIGHFKAFHCKGGTLSVEMYEGYHVLIFTTRMYYYKVLIKVRSRFAFLRGHQDFILRVKKVPYIFSMNGQSADSVIIARLSPVTND